MTDVKLKIAHSYKIPRITKFIEIDIKTIKKLNLVFQRFEKYDKEIYILELFNILKELNNVFDMNELYPVLCYFVDIRFHSTLTSMINKLDNINKVELLKLKDLVKDEC